MNIVQQMQTQKTPVISVILPLYNKAKYIARAIDSILRQTYQDFEIVVVDDGSTDNGPSIVSSYTDPRIRLIHQVNAGPGAARNRGIQESTAPFLSFLDADDEWMPEFLAKSLRQLCDHPDCAVSVAGRFRGDERLSWESKHRGFGITEGPWRMPTALNAPLMKSSIEFFHPGAVLCLREVVERFGGFYTKNRCNYGEDTYLWVCIVLNYKIYRNPAPLFWWHTEASEIAIASGRKNVPPWPMLIDPEPIRNDCPPEYCASLERYLAYLALSVARRCIRAGDCMTAKHLLRCYPLAQTFTWDYVRVQLDLMLSSMPKLQHWIHSARKIVRFL